MTTHSRESHGSDGTKQVLHCGKWQAMMLSGVKQKEELVMFYQAVISTEDKNIVSDWFNMHLWETIEMRIRMTFCGESHTINRYKNKLMRRQSAYNMYTQNKLMVGESACNMYTQNKLMVGESACNMYT